MLRVWSIGLLDKSGKMRQDRELRTNLLAKSSDEPLHMSTLLTRRSVNFIHGYLLVYIYIYTRANPCIKCTEASAVRSAVVVSSSKDIGFLSGCSDVCAPLLCLFGPLSFRLSMVVSGAAFPCLEPSEQPHWLRENECKLVPGVRYVIACS